MKAVGIKELKAKLSHYLRAVRAGEILLVTDRNDVIAELRPPTRHSVRYDSVEQVLDALVASSDVSRARLVKGQWKWQSRGLGLPAGTADALLDELRAERDR